MTLRGHESDINSVILFPDGKVSGTSRKEMWRKVGVIVIEYYTET